MSKNGTVATNATLTLLMIEKIIKKKFVTFSNYKIFFIILIIINDISSLL